MEPSQQIRELLGRVRARWRRLVLLHATARATLATALVLGVALAASHWAMRTPIALAAIGGLALLLAGAAAVWGVRWAGSAPSDRSVARFSE
jgi:hypothetical protein